MEKLELKHLAGYLPYGLKWSLQGLKTFEMQGITPSTLYTIEGTVLNWEKHPDLPQALFPILRPLSDLTKEIEVNGEKFVPIRKLEDLFPCVEFYNDDELSYLFYDTDCRGEFFYSIELSLTLEISSKLFEWHFDVFGLIEKGLAIDISTLNKQP